MVKKVAKDEKQTTYVYIMDKNHAWRPAILEDTKGDKAIVSVPEYKVGISHAFRRSKVFESPSSARL
jgi:hypothetical protein